MSLESKTTQKKMSKLRDVSLPTKGHGNRLTSTSFLSVASSSNFCHNFTHARLEFQTLVGVAQRAKKAGGSGTSVLW